MNPKVDTYLHKAKKWQEEMEQLRNMMLDCELEEEFKWYHPCYTFGEQNIVLIHSFKEYCALLFFKGALLQDEEGILIQQTKNVQSARQMRFTSLKEIIQLKKTIKAYVYEAIEVEKAGLKVTLKKTKEYEVPEELEKAFKKSAALKKAFYALTPGRQRAYLLYFSQAKQSKTREDRIKKSTPMILKGKGLNDDYVKGKK
jgi:uncharacterized protein YdeI (YjbR/CyaY-like superfamily)